MPSIGRLEYPEISFSNVLETLEKIKSKNIKTVHGLAEELGYSTKSKSPGGTFYYKLVALDNHYGLIERDRGNISLSALGQRIAFPLNDSDRSAAIGESLSRVELLRSLSQSLGNAYHDSDFRPKLRELTGASPDQIAGHATRIENLYRDAIQFVSGGSVPATPIDRAADARAPPRGQGIGETAPLQVGPPPQGPAFKDQSRPVRTLHSEDGYFIRVLLDADVIDEAIAVLDALKKRVPGKSGPLLS